MRHLSQLLSPRICWLVVSRAARDPTLACFRTGNAGPCAFRQRCGSWPPGWQPELRQAALDRAVEGEASAERAREKAAELTRIVPPPSRAQTGPVTGGRGPPSTLPAAGLLPPSSRCGARAVQISRGGQLEEAPRASKGASVACSTRALQELSQPRRMDRVQSELSNFPRFARSSQHVSRNLRGHFQLCTPM